MYISSCMLLIHFSGLAKFMHLAQLIYLDNSNILGLSEPAITFKHEGFALSFGI